MKQDCEDDIRALAKALCEKLVQERNAHHYDTATSAAGALHFAIICSSAAIACAPKARHEEGIQAFLKDFETSLRENVVGASKELAKYHSDTPHTRH